MSSHLKVLIPPPVALPRGAFWAANAVVWAAKTLSSRRPATATDPAPGVARPHSLKGTR